MISQKELENLFYNLQKAGAPLEAVLLTDVGIIKEKPLKINHHTIPVVESNVMPKDCIIMATGDQKHRIEQYLKDNEQWQKIIDNSKKS